MTPTALDLPALARRHGLPITSTGAVALFADPGDGRLVAWPPCPGWLAFAGRRTPDVDRLLTIKPNRIIFGTADSLTIAFPADCLADVLAVLRGEELPQRSHRRPHSPTSRRACV